MIRWKSEFYKKNNPKSDLCILWNTVLFLYVHENITEYFYLVCCWLSSMGNNHSYIVSVFSFGIQLVSILSFSSNFLAQKTTSVYSVEGNWNIRKIEKGRRGRTWIFIFFLSPAYFVGEFQFESSKQGMTLFCKHEKT